MIIDIVLHLARIFALTLLGIGVVVAPLHDNYGPTVAGIGMGMIVLIVSDGRRA